MWDIFLKQKNFAFLLIFSLIFSVFSSFSLLSQTYASTDSHGFFQLINNSRTANGVGLLAKSSALTAAAQQHAEDIASSGQFAHLGRNGSTVEERAKNAGYKSYPDRIWVAESWAIGDVEEAFATLLNQSADYNNIYSPNWREVGIGLAQTPSGTRVWVIVFGAQPGILPIFINHNQEMTAERVVTIQLRNETITHSQNPFSRAVEMRIAEQHLLSEASWQAWQSEVQLQLSEGDGRKRVIAQLRDRSGRLAQAWDTIYLDQAEQFVAPSVEAEVIYDATATQVISQASNTPTLPPSSASPTTPTTAGPESKILNDHESPTTAGAELSDWNIATPIVMLWSTPTASSLQKIPSPTSSPDLSVKIESNASRDQVTSTGMPARLTPTINITPNSTATQAAESQPSPLPSPEATIEVIDSTQVVLLSPTKVIESTQVVLLSPTKVIESTQVVLLSPTKVIESTQVVLLSPTKVIESTQVAPVLATKVIESTQVALLSPIASATTEPNETQVRPVKPTASKVATSTHATRLITATTMPTLDVVETNMRETKDNSPRKRGAPPVMVTATSRPTVTSTAIFVHASPTATTYSEPDSMPTATPLLLANTTSSLFSRETIKRGVRLVTLLIIELVVLFALGRLLFLGRTVLRR